MLSLYCPKCANANVYTLAKPVYCGFCGSSLSISVASAPPPTRTQPIVNKPLKSVAQPPVKSHRLRQAPVEAQGDEDETEVDGPETAPQLAQLNVEIVGSRRKFTFGDLVKESKTGFKARPTEKISQSEVMRQFQQESAGKADSIEIQDNGE